MYFWPRVVSVSYLDSNTLLLHVCVCVCGRGGGDTSLLLPVPHVIMKCSKKAKPVYTVYCHFLLPWRPTLRIDEALLTA